MASAPAPRSGASAKARKVRKQMKQRESWKEFIKKFVAAKPLEIDKTFKRADRVTSSRRVAVKVKGKKDNGDT